ncbi:unnamed protein product [Blepharisma stoltei]|uniref:DNA polymerase n=1 Tax=Blepharisma stoltei TaxID=1481888 RepID=A0AAU9K7I0_9CILI|nr:unnamed protein product [Blepharisma stoltei]
MDTPIFQDKVICILCGFCGFTKVSKDIISNNIEKLGGTTVKKISQLPENLTHLIVPYFSTESKLLKTLKISQLPDCKIVTQDWAIQSIKLKTLLPEDTFLWKCYFQRQQEKMAEVDELKRKSQIDEEYHINKQLKLQSNIKIEENFEENENQIKIEENLEIKNEENDIKIKLDPDIKIEIKQEDESSRFISDKRRRANWKEDELSKFKFYTGKQSIDNKNDHIIQMLEELKNNYTILKDKGRIIGYQKAISAIRSFPEKITSIEQLKGVNQIGKQTLQKIKEILETGSLSRVEAMDEHERLGQLKLFLNIWGVGTEAAEKLVRKGYKTIEMIKANPPDFFNENQKIGLALYDELLEKIPREEVKEISEKITKVAESLANGRQLTAITCGSYRRGRPLCGDIDILMTFEDGGAHTGLLSILVEELKKIGLVTHTLVITDEEIKKKHENSTFEGIAKLENGLHRRIDIKIYPRKTYAWALLYFTGSAMFNRSMRLFAKTKGFRLSDEGIFPAIRYKTETFTCAPIADCYTEEEIFEFFGMAYKAPEERDM